MCGLPSLLRTRPAPEARTKLVAKILHESSEDAGMHAYLQAHGVARMRPEVGRCSVRKRMSHVLLRSLIEVKL